MIRKGPTLIKLHALFKHSSTNISSLNNVKLELPPGYAPPHNDFTCEEMIRKQYTQMDELKQ
jgi:hypothetical protein